MGVVVFKNGVVDQEIKENIVQGWRTMSIIKDKNIMFLMKKKYDEYVE